MRLLNRFLARLRNASTGSRNDQRLREELDQHIALQIEENLRAGMPPAEARRQAILKLGAVQPLRESYHAEEGLPFVETLLADLRYATRMLRKSPGFTIVAIATLALGIGANAAIFTLLNAIMLRNLPVADPKSLVRLGNDNSCCVGMGMRDNGDYSLFTTASYQYFRDNLPEFDSLAAIQAGFAYRPVAARRDDSDQPARAVMGEFVSGNYFRTLGLSAPAGRLLVDRDDTSDAPFTAVMSYETWKTVYNGDPSIIGSTFRINTRSVTVVGIAPAGFYGDRMLTTPPEFYLPIASMPAIANVSYVYNSDSQWLYIIGRLKPGIDKAQLQQKVTTLLHQQLATTPRYSSQEQKTQLKKARVILTRGGGGIQAMQEDYNSHLLLLMAASGLVLLIACANIANLLLVRGVARKTEMSVRTALGAARGRIVRQLLTESVLLSALGGLAGLAVAYAGTRMLLALAFPGARNMPIHASPSLEVLAFAFGLSLFTGILFGIAPAWMASRSEPADALRSGARSTASGASILQRSLVVFQAALSLVLLVGAGLFAQSLSKLQHINLRLDASNRSIIHIDPQTAGYLPSQVGDLYRTITDRLHSIPGVEKVGISSYTPMEDNNDQWSVMVQGKPDPHRSASVIRVSPEYFDSVGTRVLAGRNIGLEDTPSSTTVAVVNKTFVKDFFKPGESPIGQHFGGPKHVNDFQIVGVVDDTAYTDARDDDHPMFFAALMQREASDTDPIDKDTSLYSKAIVLATDRPVPDMEELARRTLSAINPNLSIVKFQTFAAQIHDQFTEDRLLARLTMLFGALALLLAALGLYGVTSYTVVRRTPEIGIRMALGAEKASVIRMVMRSAMLQALVGLILGAPIAYFCIRLIKSQLYLISSVGLGVMSGSIAVLLAAAVIAGAIPARRAASINPAQTLRTE